MSESVTASNIDELVQVFKNPDDPQQISVKPEHHEQWMNNSIFFREITEELSKIPTTSTIPKESSSKKVRKESEVEVEEENIREIKLYTAAQFRSHINRLYPFHLDYFTSKLSGLDFEQHRMGLYVFYDVKNGCLINDLEKETQKKTNRGKNMKRMNGLLLNEHRMFNECAKEYAVQHFKRDYEAMKPSVNRFMEAWLQRKTDVLLKRTSSHDQYYSQRITIPLNSYDSLSPVTFVNLSTVLRLGTIPLLTVPENIERAHLKCSDNHDQIITNRFNSTYRLTNIVDDPNILSILSQHPSIDIITTKSSFHLLLELFSTSQCSSPLTLPISIREFQYETLDNPKKKVIFIEKSFRQKIYTKRELNQKFYQRSFRSLLLSTTGGKRDTTDNPFNYTAFNNKTEFQITEMKPKVSNQSVKQDIIEKTEEEEDDDDDEDDDVGMIISTDGDNEEQQKLFQKSKQKIIHSAPIIQDKDEEDSNIGPVPIISQIKLATPSQGNYEYCLWQLGTLQILIRSSYHGFCHHQILSETNTNEEYITCYSKLEYQSQFGFEQITDKEYRRIWCESYLRHGASVLLGRINVYTQQLLKIEKMNYENIDRNLKECQIDMLKPLTKLYGLLYGIQSLEMNNYLLSCSLNDNKLSLYQTISNESEEKTFDLHHQPLESNDLLIQSDCTTVPWIPLTPTLLLPYHIDFERIPLTFCPRNKRQLDIEITIPAYRIPKKLVNQQEKKRKKRLKKKANQRRKRNPKD